MNSIRFFLRFGVFLLCFTLLEPLASAQNFAKYRDFEFGMSVSAVAKQTGVDPGSAKTTYAVPALVQTLQWNRQAYFASSAKPESLQGIRFSFYNDQLFKIVATYSTEQLEGMTTPDLIEAIAKVYGTASMPDESVNVSPYTGHEDRQKVLARWENGEFAYSLFRSSYGGDFGLVAMSKALDGAATLSVREGERLDVLAAPQREIERLQKLADDRRILEEKARNVNVPNFLP